MFITFEGPSGCGKTTHIELLKKHLEARGAVVVCVSEPANMAIMLPTVESLSPLSQLFLRNAYRADKIDTVVLPALHSGQVVLYERFQLKTKADLGRLVSYKAIDELHAFSTGTLSPNITFIMPPVHKNQNDEYNRYLEISLSITEVLVPRKPSIEATHAAIVKHLTRFYPNFYQE
jgi:thymidylate kinase